MRSHSEFEAAAGASAEVYRPGMDIERIEGPAYRFAPAAELVAEWEPRRDLIADRIPVAALGELVGPPASLKSFLALHWAVNIAADGQPACYMAGEGQRGLAPRLAAAAAHRGIPLEALPVHVGTRAVPLNEPAALDEVRSALDACPEPPALLVVDTRARHMAGDENAGDVVGAFVAALDSLRAGTDLTVLVVHHVGWGDSTRGRGHSSWFGAVDFTHLCVRNGDTLEARCTKMKDGGEPAPAWFQAEHVATTLQDLDGASVGSLVLVPSDEPAPATRAAKGLGENQRRAMAALRRLTTQAQDTLEAGGYPPDGARVSLDDWRDACRTQENLQRNRFREVWPSLRDKGLITVSGAWATLLEATEGQEGAL